MGKQTTGDGTCEVWEVFPLFRPLLKLKKEKYQNFDSTPSSMLKDLLSNVILCSLNEKKGKENLGQKRLSDNTKVEFGATKDHG